MKISWSGQHTRGKALPVLLRTMPIDASLDVLGEGGETRKWKRLARKLGLEGRVRWHGWLTKDDATKIVGQSDVFVITSIRDLTSTVLLEALSLGKPVVCLDHCGFSDVVDRTCGVKINVGGPRAVLADFSTALRKLGDDPDLRRRLSHGALAKAQNYLWSEKAKALNAICCEIGRRVFVTAYACSPYRGSEPGAGWHYLQAFAKKHEVWVAYESIEFDADLRKRMKEFPDEFANVHLVPIPDSMSKKARRIWPPAYYWFHRQWHKRAYEAAKKIHAEVGLDAAYQMNMVTFREPGYLWKLPVPFIWGPVGALGYTDWRLLPLMGFVGALEYAIRNIINWCHAHFMIRPRLAARKAANTGTLIAATSENQREMRKLWGVDSSLMCEIGVDDVTGVKNTLGAHNEKGC